MLIPVTLASLQQQIQNDAHQMTVFLDWLNDRHNAYANSGVNTAYLQGLGLVQADINNYFAFTTDISRLVAFAAGNPQNSAQIIMIDIISLIGIS